MGENKHNPWDLAQMQSLPLSAKIRMTQQRVKNWYEYFDGNVYVSVSGGKDSQVLAHIVKDMYPDVPLVFVNTGLEYDSVRLNATSMADVVLHPEIDFVNVIKKYGYPVISKEVSRNVSDVKKHGADCFAWRLFNGELKDSIFNKQRYKYLIDAPFRISDRCCYIMKKKPAFKYVKETGNKPFIATMAEESNLRRSAWIKNGCNAFEAKHQQSTPMSFWTEQDVLQYIKQYKLKIAEIYGDIVYVDDDGMFYDNDLFNKSMKLQTTGANRTGCVFCLFGITQDTERFLRLKEQEPKKYDYVMRGGCFDSEGMWIPGRNEETGEFGLGYKFVIDWLNEHGNLKIKY